MAKRTPTQAFPAPLAPFFDHHFQHDHHYAIARAIVRSAVGLAHLAAPSALTTTFTTTNTMTARHLHPIFTITIMMFTS